MNTVRKRFGQNFLTDPGIINRIARAINAGSEDRVVEIGPGRGALTESLAASGCNLTLIEIDRDLAASLAEKFPEAELITADVMKTNFQDFEPGPLRVAGNLPYNISTPLLFHLFQYGSLISDMHFMLQLEVVNRMTADVSTRAYGRLSVMTQLYCETEKLFEVPPEAFTPRPKVQSAIIRLRPKPLPPAMDTNLLEKILIAAFSARRKTIRNALKGFFTPEQLESAGVNPSLRPENLTIEQFAACVSLIRPGTA